MFPVWSASILPMLPFLEEVPPPPPPPPRPLRKTGLCCIENERCSEFVHCAKIFRQQTTETKLETSYLLVQLYHHQTKNTGMRTN